MEHLEGLTNDELKALLNAYAKSWLAHDGYWFLAVEEGAGTDVAISYDRDAWRRFAPREAQRIMEARRLAPGGGLPALAEALTFRMYHLLNDQRIELTADALTFTMEGCRVQEARRRKGLPDFPCKSVGEVEFSEFARAVDGRLVTTCLRCPPDELRPGECCRWRFTLTGTT